MPLQSSDDSNPALLARHDWPRLVERAADAVQMHLAACREMSPRQIAETVISVVPADVADWVLSRLSELGWLDSDARVPFDILESAACPPDLTGGRRELLRVATFGVPGEGAPSRAKRREALYQQRCAEILRETRDLESLSYAAARALGHPEVHADPVLFNMLRSFIAEREAELRSRAHVPGTDSDEQARAARKAAEFKVPLRERVHMSLARMRLELDAHIAIYNEAGAQEVLVRINDLRKRYPAHVESAIIERCEQQVQALAAKRDLFRQQLNELVQRANEAVSLGDQKTAAWVLRRLSAINTLLPAVLPEDRLEALRETILHFSERHERHEVARQLVVREQTIGSEIKKLRAAVHQYLALLQQSDSDGAALHQAEEDYRRAVTEARSYNDEWLADLMIELDCLLDELHGDRERAESQVDSFVKNVRLALRQMRHDIRTIERLRSTPADSG